MGAYGMGTYFARDSKYSIDYAVNNNGIYQMFQCKVICGESHRGSSSYSLKSWPKKTNGLLYDTLVDNVGNPSIYVIHQNVRAYPMYIIHFKKKQSYGYWIMLENEIGESMIYFLIIFISMSIGLFCYVLF